MIAEFFSELATGLTSFIPAFFGALLQAFQVLFMVATTTEGVTTYSGLSPVGQIAVAFIVIGIAYKVLPTVVGWLRMRARARRIRKAMSAR